MMLTTSIDNFRELRERNKYYVDKTLMIKDFVDYDEKVALITRPRRFGKTLNMTMLREFFDITKDSKAIFEGLAIMETEYAALINTKPVIYLTFKNCSGESIDDLKDSIAKQMFKEYIRFGKVFKNRVDEEDIDYYVFYQTYETLKKASEPRPEGREKISRVDTGLFKSSLSTLTQAVSTFFDQHPILLIDEYDQPIVNAHIKDFREQFSEDIYADFLGEALKGNEYLGQNLVTGIQRVVKESIFSKLNNIPVYTVTSKKYATYFGFTEAETKKALETNGLAFDDDVKNYYDGYLMGGIGIYNPWAIISYLDEKIIKPYWLNTSTNALIKEAIPKADKGFNYNFERLILNQEVRVSSNLETSFVELATPQTLWGLLVNAGYLTVTKVFPSGATMVRIPNAEVKKEFRELVALYTKIDNDQLGELFNALIDQDMEDFLHNYQRLVYSYVSSHDISHRQKNEDDAKHFENSYHMLFLGMAISVSGMYEITSNLEAGHGRGDIIMESLQSHLRPHIVIEFKEGDDVEKLKQVALDQIFEKKYYVKLSGNVLCVGLAHSMKECELVYKEIVVDEHGGIA